MRPKMSGYHDSLWRFPASPNTSALADLKFYTKVEPASPEEIAEIERRIAERTRIFRTVVDARTLDKVLD